MKIKNSHFYLLLFCIYYFTNTGASAQDFKIGTFNIQNFGKSKLAKSNIVDTLASIIKKTDIIAIQEISDIENKTAFTFLKSINANGDKYKVVCSPRTGQQPNDHKSAEQYAFYFNSKTVKIIKVKLYDDTNDEFQREPYIAQFMRKSDSLQFVICTIHTAPDKAIEEIKSLVSVHKWIKSNFPTSKNIIFCGDFNASCSYASTLELDQLELRNNQYKWLVPDNADTNLAKRECAYDRFVITKNFTEYIYNWHIDRAFTSKAVSDHWPVIISLKK